MDILYITALRQGDILSIRLSQLTDEGLFVNVSKSGKPVIFEWSESLKTAVKAARSLSRPVSGLFLFCTRTGSRYTTGGFRSIWQRRMRSALENGILKERFTSHDLRGKSGSDAQDVRRATELLGHSDQKITIRHYRRLPERVKPLK